MLMVGDGGGRRWDGRPVSFASSFFFFVPADRPPHSSPAARGLLNLHDASGLRIALSSAVPAAALPKHQTGQMRVKPDRAAGNANLESMVGSTRPQRTCSQERRRRTYSGIRLHVVTAMYGGWSLVNRLRACLLTPGRASDPRPSTHGEGRANKHLHDTHTNIHRRGRTHGTSTNMLSICHNRPVLYPELAGLAPESRHIDTRMKRFPL